MTQEYVPGQNDPHQEPPKPELTYGEAIRLVAEGVSFRTEQVRDAVYAAIDKEHGDSEVPDDDEGQADGDDASGGSSSPVKATPAKKTAARATR